MISLTTPVHFTLPFDFESMGKRFASIGSCFSERVVELLSDGGFQCCSNPNGIVYNPVSIADSLAHIVKNIPYTEQDLFFFNGKYHSWKHHGSFSAETKEETLTKMERARSAFADFLKHPCPAVLTFGTAVVFRENHSGAPVANCHKVPGTEFSRELLPIQLCCDSICSAVEHLLSAGEHPVLLSVSPVRHHPGDPVLNSRSKSILIEACHQAAERFAGRCAYFPAYELLHDELRDYRFYKDDLIHPSAVAEQYILETFLKKCFPASADNIISLADSTRKRNMHVPGGIK